MLSYAVGRKLLNSENDVYERVRLHDFLSQLDAALLGQHQAETIYALEQIFIKKIILGIEL